MAEPQTQITKHNNLGHILQVQFFQQFMVHPHLDIDHPLTRLKCHFLKACTAKTKLIKQTNNKNPQSTIHENDTIYVYKQVKFLGTYILLKNSNC